MWRRLSQNGKFLVSVMQLFVKIPQRSLESVHDFVFFVHISLKTILAKDILTIINVKEVKRKGGKKGTKNFSMGHLWIKNIHAFLTQFRLRCFKIVLYFKDRSLLNPQPAMDFLSLSALIYWPALWLQLILSKWYLSAIIKFYFFYFTLCLFFSPL